MPCSCDGYEPRASDVRAELGAQIKHLEQSLCNAQSLIHKILKEIVPIYNGGDDVDTAVRDLIDPQLVARADQHIAMLVQHKRAEHEADRAEATRKLNDLDRQAQNESRAREFEEAQRTATGQARMKREAERIQEARRLQNLVSNPAPTDEELLG